MPKMTWEITAGNMMNLMATLGSLLAMVITITLAYGALRETDAVFAHRLATLEAKQVRGDSDHDILMEIRQDLKGLRQQFEVNGRRTELRPALPHSVDVP